VMINFLSLFFTFSATTILLSLLQNKKQLKRRNAPSSFIRL